MAHLVRCFTEVKDCDVHSELLVYKRLNTSKNAMLNWLWSKKSFTTWCFFFEVKPYEWETFMRWDPGIFLAQLVNRAVSFLMAWWFCVPFSKKFPRLPPVQGAKRFGSQPTTMECNMILGTGIGQNSMTQNFFQHPAILIQKPGQWPVSCGSYWMRI